MASIADAWAYWSLLAWNSVVRSDRGVVLYTIAPTWQAGVKLRSDVNTQKRYTYDLAPLGLEVVGTRRCPQDQRADEGIV